MRTALATSLFFFFVFLAEEHFELRVYELISAHFDLGSSSAGLVGGGGDAGSGSLLVVVALGEQRIWQHLSNIKFVFSR